MKDNIRRVHVNKKKNSGSEQRVKRNIRNGIVVVVVEL